MSAMLEEHEGFSKQVERGCLLVLFLISNKFYSFIFIFCFQYIQMSFLSLHHSHSSTPTPAHFSSSNNIVLENAFPEKTVKEASQDLYIPLLASGFLL